MEQKFDQKINFVKEINLNGTSKKNKRKKMYKK